MRRLMIAMTLGGALAASAALAHEDSHSHIERVKAVGDQIKIAQVTSQEEKDQAAEMQASGPKKTKGIKGVKLLGSVSLANQFDDVNTRVLRARELEIEPGGVVAVHRHDGRPGVAYIISGQMTEHRAGVDGGVVKRAGDTAFEESGTVHWWINEGDEVAKALVVDIVPAE